jgi:hypothetical protein
MRSMTFAVALTLSLSGAASARNSRSTSTPATASRSISPARRRSPRSPTRRSRTTSCLDPLPEHVHRRIAQHARIPSSGDRQRRSRYRCAVNPKLQIPKSKSQLEVPTRLLGFGPWTLGFGTAGILVHGAGARMTSTTSRAVPSLRIPCGTPSGATTISPDLMGSSRPSRRTTPSPSTT